MSEPKEPKDRGFVLYVNGKKTKPGKKVKLYEQLDRAKIAALLDEKQRESGFAR